MGIETLTPTQLEQKVLDAARLFIAARDALPAISASAAKLHNVDMRLADRIDNWLKPWALTDGVPKEQYASAVRGSDQMANYNSKTYTYTETIQRNFIVGETYFAACRCRTESCGATVERFKLRSILPCDDINVHFIGENNVVYKPEYCFLNSKDALAQAERFLVASVAKEREGKAL